MSDPRHVSPYSIDATMDPVQERVADGLPVPPHAAMDQRPLAQYQVHPAARYFRRGPWENAATIIIALGVIMLLQPVSMALYTYSFVTMLAGTAMFMIVSKFPE